MAIEVLYPNGDDNGWPTGDYLNIDEGIASADGSTLETNVDNDVVIVDLDDSLLEDADTINSVTVKIRAKDTGAGGKNELAVDLLIGGTGQGEVVGAVMNNSYATYTFTDATNWDIDWTAAQLDGMQLSIRADQTGKGSAADWIIDAIDVEIDYTAGSGAALESAVTCSVTTTSVLTTAIQMLSSVSCAATIAAALTTGIPLLAAASASCTTAADLTVPGITQTLLDSGITTTNTTSKSTNSVTPGANKLILAVVNHSAVTETENSTPTCSGNGLTWVQIASIVNASTWGRITVFRAMGSSPSSGAITFDWGTDIQDDIEWAIHEFGNEIETGGTNGSDAVVQVVTNNNSATKETSGSVTLSAFSNTNNATFGAVGTAELVGSTSYTPGAGFTELTDLADASSFSALMTEWRNDNDTTVDGSWTGTRYWAFVGIEIKAASEAAELATSVTCACTTTTALTTSIDMVAATVASATATADLTTSIDMVAAASAAVTTAAALTTSIDMAAVATGSATASADLTTGIQLASSVTCSAINTTNDLTTGIPLLAAATCTVNTTSYLTTSIDMAAAASAAVTTAAALTTSIDMVAATTCSATATAELTTGINMAAAATGACTTSADLTAPSGGAELVAAATGSVTTSADLTTSIDMAAAASAAVTTTAALTTSIDMVAAATGSVTTSADLTAGGAGAALEAAVIANATMAAALTTSIDMVAAATGSVTTSADLTTSIDMAAAASAAVTTAAELTTSIDMAAAATGSVTTSADLTTGIPLLAAASASASTAAALTTSIDMVSNVNAQVTALVELFTDGGVGDVNNPRIDILTTQRSIEILTPKRRVRSLTLDRDVTII